MGDKRRPFQTSRDTISVSGFPTRGRRDRAVFVGISLVAVFLCEFAVAAEAPPFSVPQVKAAQLYKLISFIEWPAEAHPNDQTPITFGILGEDPFGAAFEELLRADKNKGRPIVIKHFKTPKELTFCHVLFIAASEKRNWSEIAQKIQGQSVLTVGDYEEFAVSGGIIHFFIEDNSIRFEINLAAAERARLKISSQVLNLKLVKIVRDSSS